MLKLVVLKLYFPTHFDIVFSRSLHVDCGIFCNVPLCSFYAWKVRTKDRSCISGVYKLDLVIFW